MLPIVASTPQLLHGGCFFLLYEQVAAENAVVVIYEVLST